VLTIVLCDARGVGVMAGSWQDPSGGDIVTTPSDLDIDHIVPLAKAVPREAGPVWIVETAVAISPV
jgi:hypothetical protein